MRKTKFLEIVLIFKSDGSCKLQTAFYFLFICLLEINTDSVLIPHLYRIVTGVEMLNFMCRVPLVAIIEALGSVEHIKC
jgi:hypothetical protein